MREKLFVADYMLMNSVLTDECSAEAHSNKNPEIIYLLNGKYQVITEKQKFILEAGEVLVIPPLVRYELKGAEHPTSLYIQVNYDLAKKYIEFQRIRFDAEIFHKDSYEMKKLQKSLNRIINMSIAEDRNIDMLVQSAYCELLYHLKVFLESDEIYAENNEEERKRQIVQYIITNYSSEITLQDLAEHLHLSRVYLSKYFKQLFGTGFLQYLTEFRLTEACSDLIGYQDRGILRIAMDNGFPNLASFHKAFRERYKMTPGEFKLSYVQKETQTGDEADLKRKTMEYLSALQMTGDQKTWQYNDNENQSGIFSGNRKESRIYEKNWNKIINAGRVQDLQYQEMQKQLLLLGKNIRFQYVRMWNLYSKELMLFGRDGRNDFARLDRIFDFLIENDFSLYLDIGFKPHIVLKGLQNPLLVEMNQDGPLEQEEFAAFWRAFFRHYTKRYGSDTVKKWYFEYWYDFRNTDPEKEKQALLHIRTVRAFIDEYAPGAKLGGLGDYADIFETKLSGALEALDFISIYAYPEDAGRHKELYDNHVLSDAESIAGKAGKAKELLKKHRMDKELIISEWSLSVSNRNILNDSVFKGAYIVKACIDSLEKADKLAYWLASDLYSELADLSSILFGGTGLITRNGIRKPAYYAFEFMNSLGRQLIASGEHGMITEDADGDYRIVCHNCKPLNFKYYNSPEKNLDLNCMTDYFENEEELGLSLRIDGVEDGVYVVKSRFINRDNGSVQDEWMKIRQQDELSKRDIEYLKNISTPRINVEKIRAAQNRLVCDIRLLANEIRYIHIYRIIE